MRCLAALSHSVPLYLRTGHAPCVVVLVICGCGYRWQPGVQKPWIDPTAIIFGRKAWTCITASRPYAERCSIHRLLTTQNGTLPSQRDPRGDTPESQHLFARDVSRQRRGRRAHLEQVQLACGLAFFPRDTFPIGCWGCGGRSACRTGTATRDIVQRDLGWWGQRRRCQERHRLWWRSRQDGKQRLR